MGHRHRPRDGRVLGAARRDGPPDDRARAVLRQRPVADEERRNVSRRRRRGRRTRTGAVGGRDGGRRGGPRRRRLRPGRRAGAGDGPAAQPEEHAWLAGDARRVGPGAPGGRARLVVERVPRVRHLRVAARVRPRHADARLPHGRRVPARGRADRGRGDRPHPRRGHRGGDRPSTTRSGPTSTAGARRCCSRRSRRPAAARS